MTVDNFTQIADILRNKVLEAGDFFFVQIVQRRKDNPEMDSQRYEIDSLYAKDADDLLKKKDRIVKLCIDNNARAYIRLNKRNQKKVALQTLALIAQNIAAENYDIKSCYKSCAGQYHSDVNKTWLLDIDDDEIDKTVFPDMMNYVLELVTETKRVPVFHKIPTRNGFHVICPPFNIKKFEDRYGPISFHKDNPTILYH